VCTITEKKYNTAFSGRCSSNQSLLRKPHGRGTEKKKNVFSNLLLLLSKPKSVKQTNKDTLKQGHKEFGDKL
jgi:hypothetical protein